MSIDAERIGSIIKALRYAATIMDPVGGDWAYEVRTAATILEKAYKAGFINNDGKVKKVLGTLPVTEQDDIIGISRPEESESVFIRRDDLEKDLVVGMRGELYISQWRNLRRAYSSREAAEAAKNEESL